MTVVYSIAETQPCRCLCLGFSQITITRPFLLIILHLSQMRFSEDLTFISKPHYIVIYIDKQFFLYSDHREKAQG